MIVIRKKEKVRKQQKSSSHRCEAAAARRFCAQLPANGRLRTGSERESCLSHTLLGWCTIGNVGSARRGGLASPE